MLYPARAIAYLHTHPNQEDLLTPAQWSAFLGPYLATRSQIDPILSERLELWCGGFSILWACTISLCRRNTGTVVMASDGGMGAGISFTVART